MATYDFNLDELIEEVAKEATKETAQEILDELYQGAVDAVETFYDAYAPHVYDRNWNYSESPKESRVVYYKSKHRAYGNVTFRPTGSYVSLFGEYKGKPYDAKTVLDLAYIYGAHGRTEAFGSNFIPPHTESIENLMMKVYKGLF